MAVIVLMILMINICATENGAQFGHNNTNGTNGTNGTIMEQAFRGNLQNIPTKIVIGKLTQEELNDYLRTKTLPDRMAEIARNLTSI